MLKAAFVRVYNQEFKDKANFYKAFLANVEKVIEKNNISGLTDRIEALDTDISGLITSRLMTMLTIGNNKSLIRN